MTRTRRLTLAALAILAALLLGAGSASATTGGLEFLSSFNAPGTELAGLAVRQSNGDVYVADNLEVSARTGSGINGIVDVFNASGGLESTMATGSERGAQGVAVDEANGKTYVVLTGEEHEAYGSSVAVFGPSGAYETTWTGPNQPSERLFREYTFVAVDNSCHLKGLSGEACVKADPSNGDVYVSTLSEATRRYVVDKFDAEGHYLGQFNDGEVASEYDEYAADITVDSSGNIYLANKGFTSSSTVDEYSSEGKYIRQLTGFARGALLSAVVVDGAGGDVYVAERRGAVDLFDSSGTFQAQTLGTSGGPFTDLLGIGIDESTGRAYVSDTGTKLVDAFGPAPLPPAPSTDPVSEVTGTSATFHGDLNPGGVSTGYFFYYSPGTSCFGPTATPVASAGSGSVDIHEEATATGLAPNTQFDVCVEAVVGETVRSGPPVTFTTQAIAPTIEGSPTASAAALVTTVEARVNPENQDTTCKIEYAENEHYEKTKIYEASVPCVPSDLGTGRNELFPGEATEPTRAAVELGHLRLGTLYHYRVVASNATGATASPDQTFMTPPPAPVVSTGAASAVTQSEAAVTGTVDPEGLASTYYYEFGPSGEYGQSEPGAPGEEAGSGSGGVPAPFTLTELTPGTTYHYRLVAVNEDGTSYGQDETFATAPDLPPIVSTGEASGVSVSGATISGTVDPQGVQSVYTFEYGVDTGYGTQVSGTAYPEQGVQTVMLSLQGLLPGTTYHYRLVASNADAGAAGEDATFTTPGILDPLVSPPSAPLIASLRTAFPLEAGTSTKRALTKAQKLAKALKACRKDKQKSKHAACEASARKKYSAASRRPHARR